MKNEIWKTKHFVPYIMYSLFIFSTDKHYSVWKLNVKLYNVGNLSKDLCCLKNAVWNSFFVSELFSSLSKRSKISAVIFSAWKSASTSSSVIFKTHWNRNININGSLNITVICKIWIVIKYNVRTETKRSREDPPASLFWRFLASATLLMTLKAYIESFL